MPVLQNLLYLINKVSPVSFLCLIVPIAEVAASVDTVMFTKQVHTGTIVTAAEIVLLRWKEGYFY